MIRTLIAAAAGLALVGTLTSCTTNSEPTVEVGPETILLDVRTPEEFAGGHLEGAELLDFNSGQFAAQLPSLDPNAEYLVYCRSGNRAGQAIALMQQNGFENVTNLGSVEQAASATGIAIVK